MLYNAASDGKSDDCSKKSRQDANRILASEDWIDCDVHFGLDVDYVGYLYGVARAGGRFPQRNTMTATDDLRDPADKIGIKDIEEQLDSPSIFPEISAEQKNDSSEGPPNFRPLTTEEKKEFVNSLDAKGKRILAELEGKSKSSRKSAAQAVGSKGPRVQIAQFE
jgi:hypothetical protein